VKRHEYHLWGESMVSDQKIIKSAVYVSFALLLTMVSYMSPSQSALAQTQATVRAKGQTESQTVKPANWIDNLPATFQQSILWKADYETGNLEQWSIPTAKYPGGGILLTAEDDVTAKATTVQAHSGKYSGEATIRNAIRATRGNKAVRFMRWTTDAYDRGGAELPLECYYSTWVYLPEAYDPKKHAPWDPGDGGWWNIFQFKSNDEQNESQSGWSLNLEKDPQSRRLSCYLYSQINSDRSWEPEEAVEIPVRKWFHIEAFVKVSQEETGRIEIWLDGESIIRADNVRTAVKSPNPNIMWGIGNYTDHIDGGRKIGTATIYFDDSLISTKPASPFAARDSNASAVRN
jgi:hypothetical protein